ncbi:MAG: helix-turn-helix domain-containing protein [Cyanobacteriota bacterium]|nr:helix-turn-helix domain-containing protein [Cyanobacteriota bacterium]
MLRTIRNTVVLAPVAPRPTAPSTGLPIQLQAGQCVLLDPGLRPSGACLEVLEGIARVFCPCEETEGMTIAFLQAGDQLRTDRLCSEGVCVEALTALSFHRPELDGESLGFDAVNEWTLQLLRIRHLGNADKRLHALLSLLARRLGRRCGAWCDLPFRLTHERIAELIGTTRVTTTRLLSRIRSAELLMVPAGEPGLRLAPSWVEAAPLAEG